MDYISCWFKKASGYIVDVNSKYAFVTTNSISQGEQVAILWPQLLISNLEIIFAHPSFKWQNNAKSNAGVTVAIVGVGAIGNKNKTIIKDGLTKYVNSINPYLVSGKSVYVEKRTAPLSNIPKISFGSMPNDGGNLLLDQSEYISLIESNRNSEKFLRKFLGSREFINDIPRYCLWINENELDQAIHIKEISKRLNLVKAHRLSSNRKSTSDLADLPYRFAEVRYKKSSAIILPKVSSERREYIPLGFLEEGTVISDLAFAVYDAEPFLLSILSSRMHMTWVRIVGGRLKTDYRYSSSLCYNTFPYPNISNQRKQEITQCAFRLLEEREKHSDKTLAQLYDPDKMPDDLREAHHQNDLAIERCYRNKPFESDDERLEYLFKRYEKMIAIEKEKEEKAKQEKKTRKKK